MNNIFVRVIVFFEMLPLLQESLNYRRATQVNTDGPYNHLRAQVLQKYLCEYVCLHAAFFALSNFVEFELLCPAGVVYSKFTKSVLGFGMLMVAFLARSLLRTS